MTHLERMLEEEKQMEQEQYGVEENPTVVEVAPSQEIPEPTPTPISLETEEVVEVVVKPEEVIVQTQEKPTKVSWKKRYSTYKASTDNTIAELRRESASMMDKLSNALTRIDGLTEAIASKTSRSDMFEGVITQEDTDSIGEEAVDILKRTTIQATENATAPLKEEIKRLKKAEADNLANRAKTEREKAYNEQFLKPLAKLVPDYQDLDLDQGFMTYLEDVDPSTGQLRKTLFSKAEASMDAKRTADFFIEYKNSKNSKQSILEQKVTPVANSAGSANDIQDQVQDSFTMDEVSEYYRDHEKGKYRGKENEWNILEARIDRAYINGNIN